MVTTKINQVENNKNDWGRAKMRLLFFSSCVVLVVLLPMCVEGHGYMHVPPTRNVAGNQIQASDTSLPGVWNSPSFANAAPSICGGGDTSQLSRTEANGMGFGTGDIMHPDYTGKMKPGGGEDIDFMKHQSVFPTDANGVPLYKGSRFKPGGVLTAEIVIKAVHWGYFNFWICDTSTLQGNRLTKECFKAGGPLKRVYGMKDDKSPLNEDYPDRYYFGNGACPNAIEYKTDTGVAAQWVEAASRHRVYLQIPEDLKCEHCVLQWWWHCSQSCTHAEYKSHPMFSASDVSVGGPGWKGALYCNAPGSKFHANLGMALCTNFNDDMDQTDGFEQFKQCADIYIGEDGSSPPTEVPTDAATDAPPPTTPTDGPDNGDCSDYAKCIETCVDSTIH